MPENLPELTFLFSVYHRIPREFPNLDSVISRIQTTHQTSALIFKIQKGCHELKDQVVVSYSSSNKLPVKPTRLGRVTNRPVNLALSPGRARFMKPRWRPHLLSL